MESDDDTTRRGLLKVLVAAGGAAVAAVVAPDDAEARKKRRKRGALAVPSKKGQIVYRLSSRNSHACKACRIHHRFMVFLTHALANANRAHRGCNCRIVPQKINRRAGLKLFPKGSPGVADLRKVQLRTGKA